MSEQTDRFLAYVETLLERFSSTGDLIAEQSVSPEKVNRALAEYKDVLDELAKEYQKIKIEHATVELEFEMWYDDRFEEARAAVMDLYKETKTIKPAVKEYDTWARTHNKSEYKDFKEKLIVLDAQSQFLIRQRETLWKQESILVTIAANMRGEMRALGIDRRGGDWRDMKGQKVEPTPDAPRERSRT